MLETRMPPISARPRRSQTSARPEARFEDVRSEEVRAQVRPAASARRERAAVREQAPDPSIRRALPSARQSRMLRSEMRLMGIATITTAITCALLLVYLAAYAHVTQLGIEQSQARAHLHQSEVRNELLQAERNRLESPQRIVTAAVSLGMTPRGATPIDYIAARPVPSGTGPNGVEIASGGDQGSSGGTTEDSSAAASFHH